MSIKWGGFLIWLHNCLVYLVPGIKPMAMWMLGKHWPTELHTPGPFSTFWHRSKLPKLVLNFKFSCLGLPANRDFKPVPLGMPWPMFHMYYFNSVWGQVMGSWSGTFWVSSSTLVSPKLSPQLRTFSLGGRLLKDILIFKFLSVYIFKSIHYLVILKCVSKNKGGNLSPLGQTDLRWGFGRCVLRDGHLAPQPLF